MGILQSKNLLVSPYFNNRNIRAKAVWCIIITYLCYRQWKNRHYYRTLFLNYLINRPKVDSSILRTTFNNIPNIRPAITANHSHGESAAVRSAATNFVDLLGRSSGFTPYFYQMSKADERNDRVGYRDYRWSKDLSVEPHNDSREGNLLSLIDVDYYVDLADIVQPDEPVIMYTFQPSKVAKSTGEYSYTFIDPETVEYKVSGGATYEHKVWNYSVDNLSIVKTFCGIAYQTLVYLVDRRKVDEDHEMVLLSPVGSFGFFASFGVNWMTGTNQVKHINVGSGPFSCLMTKTKTQHSISIGKKNNYLQATIPIEEHEALVCNVQTMKNDIILPTVQTYVKDRSQASMLLEYYRSLPTQQDPSYVFPLESSIFRYQYTKYYDPDAKAALVPFMSPIMVGCYAPDINLVNEVACVKYRIEGLAKEMPDPTPKFIKLMYEFIDLTMAGEILIPVTEDEVYVQQPRPSQRAILHQAEYSLADRIVKLFIKKEAYQGIKDPRPISIINGVDKRDYSKYIYALANFISKKPWYAFGKTPVEIATRVADICKSAKINACTTDYVRMDGNISYVARLFEHLLLMRAFGKEHHNTLMDLHGSQYGLKGYTTKGHTYYTGYSRLSGSLETAIFNGLASAFNDYAHRRNTKLRTKFISPEEAYAQLGIYGGDDGLSIDVNVQIYTKTAVSYGQNLDAVVFNIGDKGINFLSRFYGPEVWKGDNTSMCDIPRALTKFHTTVGIPLSNMDKLFEKSYALFLSDKNTPVVGDFVRTVVKLMPNKIPDYANKCNIWNGKLEQEKQYPNEYNDWMMAYFNEWCPGFNAKKFLVWAFDCTAPEELLKPVLCDLNADITQHKPAKETVICDEQLIEPDENKYSSETENAPNDSAKVEITSKPKQLKTKQKKQDKKEKQKRTQKQKKYKKHKTAKSVGKSPDPKGARD